MPEYYDKIQELVPIYYNIESLLKSNNISPIWPAERDNFYKKYYDLRKVPEEITTYKNYLNNLKNLEAEIKAFLQRRPI